jgi:F-type H+-transporting ATPase subunit delta
MAKAIMDVLDSRYARALLSLAAGTEEADAMGGMLTEFSGLLQGNSELRGFLLNPLVAAGARKSAAISVIEGGSADIGGSVIVGGSGGGSERGSGGTAKNSSGSAIVGGSGERGGVIVGGNANSCSGERSGGSGGTAKNSSGSAIVGGSGERGSGSAEPRAPDAARRVCHFVCLLIDKRRLSALPDIAERYHRLKSAARRELRVTAYSPRPLDDSQLGQLRQKYAKQYGAAAVYIANIVDPALLGGIIVQIGDLRIDGSVSGRLAALRRALA